MHERTKRGLLLGALLVGAGPLAVRAQVEFRCVFPSTQVLRFEALPAVVTLVNETDQPLRSDGDAPFTVSFDVADHTGAALRMRKEQAVTVPRAVAARSTVTFTNDLQLLFPVDDKLELAVRARLQANGRAYVTEKSLIDILPGSEVARLEATTPDGAPRVYSLRTINRDKRDRLFLRIDDEAAGLCYGVFDLGRYLRVGRPSLEADHEGNVHVLHLSAPNQFTYSVYSASGKPVEQRLVAGDTSSVRLERQKTGGFRVIGAGPSPSPTEPMVEPLPMRRSL